MTFLYEEYKLQEDIQSLSLTPNNIYETSWYDINNWQFAKMNKLEDELIRYLKTTLLILTQMRGLTYWHDREAIHKNIQHYFILLLISF